MKPIYEYLVNDINGVDVDNTATAKNWRIIFAQDKTVVPRSKSYYIITRRKDISIFKDDLKRMMTSYQDKMMSEWDIINEVLPNSSKGYIAIEIKIYEDGDMLIHFHIPTMRKGQSSIYRKNLYFVFDDPLTKFYKEATFEDFVDYMDLSSSISDNLLHGEFKFKN